MLLSVRDEGPGIPPDELEAVFDKFVQSSKTKSNKGGTGLGLAICREIVAGHKGRIWAENNSGAGCIFYVELPVAHPDLMPSDSLAELDVAFKKRRNKWNAGRILIVDDDASALTFCVGSVRGIQLKTAATGNECLAKLTEFKPHLVLLDIMMPGIRRARNLPADQVQSIGRLRAYHPCFRQGNDRRSSAWFRRPGRRLPCQAVRSRGIAFKGASPI